MLFIGRFLLILLILYLVRILIAALRGSPRLTRPTGLRNTVRGSMVKDPVCGTYVDVTLALREKRNGTDLYFCSDACRQKYVA